MNNARENTGRGLARRLWIVLAAALVAVAIAVPCLAANIGILWLDQSPTAFNSTLPNNAVYNVPGIGNVTVTYSVPGDWTVERGPGGASTTGNVVFGPNTYSWTNFEHFSTIFVNGLLGPVAGTITYQFPSTRPAGSIFIGTIGLGATTSFGGGTSTTTVSQNGTFLGDWVPGPGFGPTQFNPGFGTFSLQNSLTGAGGADPWWNTYLGVTRVDDAVSSITVVQSQLRGDGIGVNVGFVAPGSVAVEHTTWTGIKGLYRN